MSKWHKRTLAQRVLDDLQTQIKAARTASEEARVEANRQSHAMQSRYDTFREEGQALASAHAKRFPEMSKGVKLLEEFVRDCIHLDDTEPEIVTVGTVVTIEDEGDGTVQNFFLVPCGGGKLLSTPAGSVRTLNLSSPMGQAILRKSVDDEVVLTLGGQRKRFSILEVS